MARLYEMIDRVAPTPIHVLLSGETGVGKEVVAEQVHARSPRRMAPFVPIHCAAIPESLMESELFGYEPGAFTGAASGKPGLIEAAHRGTVLLDEIGALPCHLQAKLLRATESNEVMRLGGLRARPVDVRFIAATNRDLPGDVTAGLFRADLLFRLNGVHLHVPPLRDRPGDIAALAELFVARVAERMGLEAPPSVSPAAMVQLLEYPWPGNVRELRNVIERAVALRSGASIAPW
ncbi:MAG: sigma 54-interacting transcriptional regulator, partial [Myxococcales bacterium]|nr:sigma 54-interacting transcriptional regulator [Myxococcales bacterium]